MKKLIKIIIAFASVICLCACNGNKNISVENETNIFATVNGEEITYGEIDYYKARLRPTVISELKEKYSAEYSENFWSQSFDGETAESLLEKRALDSAIRSKLLLVEMKKKDIYTDITFQGLKNQAIDFNSHSDEHKVGLKTINMSEFYTYYIENGKLELKNRLEPSELGISEKEISSRAEEILSSREDINEQEAYAIAENQLINDSFDKHFESIFNNAEIVIT